MKKWLFNPFTYIAGAQALAIGWGIMIVTSIICFFSKTHFDGVLDLHYSANRAPYWMHLAEPLIDWVILTITIYGAGLAFSKSSIRIIDVAGTISLARWPMLFAALIGFFIHVPAKMQTLQDIQNVFTASMIFFSILELVFNVWMVALFYNAFSVSCNLKGSKSAWIFVAAILLSEIFSKTIYFLLSKQLN